MDAHMTGTPGDTHNWVIHTVVQSARFSCSLRRSALAHSSHYTSSHRAKKPTGGHTSCSKAAIYHLSIEGLTSSFASSSFASSSLLLLWLRHARRPLGFILQRQRLTLKAVIHRLFRYSRQHLVAATRPAPGFYSPVVACSWLLCVGTLRIIFA